MKAQKKQQRYYNRRHTLPTSAKVKDEAWLKNQRRLYRKGGKVFYKWVSLYVAENISKKGLCTLRNQNGVEQHNVVLLKPYLDPVNPALSRIKMFHLMRNHQICKTMTLINLIFKIWKVYFKRTAIRWSIDTQMHKLSSLKCVE